MQDMSGEVARCVCGNISVLGAAAVRPSCSCHAGAQVENAMPNLRIHAGAIAFSDASKVQVHSPSHHNVDVVCRQCGCQLSVHASKKGARCEWSRPQIITGSLPAVRLQAPAQPVPTSMRKLFANPEFDRPDGDDYDLMFSGCTDPFVGSYSELGRLVTDSEYLAFVH